MLNRHPIMQGFAQKFRTPVEYIIDITHEIWEDGGIDLIESDYYGAICPVYTPLGTSRTAADVTAGTRATLAEFPDRHLLADDVIIGIKPDNFYSSHRVRSTATHLGPGRFGPPTGRPIGMLTIADCVCRENRIIEEWLVRDQAGIARQVGLDPKLLGYEIGRTARAMAAPGPEALLQRWADANGQTIVGDTALAARAMAAMTELWTRKAATTFATHYDRAVRLEAPSAELIHGVHQVQAFYADLHASLPDGTFAIQHVIALEEAKRPPRVALRWSYVARHAGKGRYGLPSLVPIVLLGLTHLEYQHDRIKSEVMLIDELSVYAQIAGARG